MKKNRQNHKRLSGFKTAGMESPEAASVTLRIDRINHLGLGVAKQDETHYTVPGVLAGELVRVKPLGRLGGFVQADCLDVLEASPLRAEPACPVFGACGGCQLQHIAYEEQLRLKSSWLALALKDFPGVKIQAVIPSPQIYGYRDRITLHHNRRQFGFHESSGHKIIPIERCAIASEAVNAHLTPAILHEPSPVEVRAAGLAVPGQFTQVNPAMNEILIQTVCALAGRGGTLLELYAGAGNFTLALAKEFRSVLAIEGNAQAVRAGSLKAKEAGLKKISFRAEDVNEAVFAFTQELKRFDVIVCDPPREGLMNAASYVGGLGAGRIVLISCHPVSFARDALALMKRGYHLESVTPLDMFPQTVHLENVGLFTKQG